MNTPHNYSHLIEASIAQQKQEAEAEQSAMNQRCIEYKTEKESALRPFILAMNEIKGKYPKLHCHTTISPWHHNGKIICNEEIGFFHPKYNDGRVTVDFDGNQVSLNVRHTSGFQPRTISSYTSQTAEELIPEFIHLLAEAIRHHHP